jgi:iron(III) transport system ATP-binding protein
MLSVSAVSKDYIAEDDRIIKAARDITFEVPRGKMFTLLGPSGCGKTTTLRSIAGLEKPDAGEISVDDRIVFSSEKGIYIPPNHRNFGMVFQSYAIWPHMTVFQNVAFPLQVGPVRHSRAQVREKVLRALHVVALDGLEGRRATQLSGGQQQRLALARALVSEPPLLLLDEPLSNLDAKLRERMRFELKRLQEDLGLTSVYVTHDQAEALALSHQVAVMSQGKIVQIGSPREIYGRPANRFVADFVGTTNLVPGTVLGREGEDGIYAIEVPFGVIAVHAFDALDKGSDALVSIRPEHITVSDRERRNGAKLSNSFEAIVRTQVFLGDRQELELRVGETVLQARAETTFDVASGGKVFITLDRQMCNVCLG